MEQKAKDQIKQQGNGNQQRAQDLSGHAGMGGHGGDLHDADSAQSGMTGRGGMGGNEAGVRGTVRQGQAEAGPGNPDDDLIGLDEPAEIQQSAQREGMGNHRHSSRRNENALDAGSDVDDLGSHRSAGGKSHS